MAQPTEQDRLMARYSISPMGNGAHSVYDSVHSEHVAHFDGKDAYQRALAEWHTLCKTRYLGMDRNATVEHPRQRAYREARASR